MTIGFFLKRLILDPITPILVKLSIYLNSTNVIFYKIPIYLRLIAFNVLLFFDLFLFYSNGFDFGNYMPIFINIRVIILTLIAIFFIFSIGISDNDTGKSVYYLTISYTVYSITFIIFSYFEILISNILYSHYLPLIIYPIILYHFIKDTKFHIIGPIFTSVYTPLYYRSDRLLYYLIIFVSILSLSLAIFAYFGIINTDIESARYMISALIQSEAAIIAIVITFTLVAVQYTASTYSTRVIDVFNVRNQDFWIVLLTYIVSMIYGLGILKLLKTSNYDVINPESFHTLDQLNLHIHVSLLYSIGIFAFISLIPYMANIINLFKPSEMIKILSEDITWQNLKSKNEKNGETKFNFDCFLPIFDILRSSLLKHDYENIKGLDEFGKRIFVILVDKHFTDDELTKILSLIFEEFNNIGLMSFDKINNQVTNELIGLIGKILIIAEEDEKINSTKKTILVLEEMGIIAKKKRMDYFVNKIINILDDTKNKSQNLEIIQYISNSKKSISDYV